MIWVAVRPACRMRKQRRPVPRVRSPPMTISGGAVRQDRAEVPVWDSTGRAALPQASAAWREKRKFDVEALAVGTTGLTGGGDVPILFESSSVCSPAEAASAC